MAALLAVPRFFLPAEDAVILFHYSQNLAHHGAITFYAGGPHAEGATDFAWMLLVAAAVCAHISPFWFTAVVNVLSLLLLSATLLRLAEVRVSPRRLLALVGCAALFPQIVAAASGFAVLPDALLLTVLVLCVEERRVELACVTALVLCLFRPDGVVFAVPLLIALLLSGQSRARTALAMAAIFVTPGVLYFLWRWHYFGELFPLPFLVKSNVGRAWGLFVPYSLRPSLKYLFFGAIVLLPFLCMRGARRRSLAIGLLLIPTFFYWAMLLEQNVGDRFYFYLPLACAILLAVNWKPLASRHALIAGAGCIGWLAFIAMPLYRETLTFRDLQFGNVKGIAQELRHAAPGGTMIVTEAGFLPYYSGWRAYDAWGLNTAAFANHLIQPGDVERIGPDLIVLHPDPDETCLPQPGWQRAYSERAWPHMTRNLILGAEARRYQLWLLPYGSEFYQHRRHWSYGDGDRECWFLLRSSPRYAAMTTALRAHGGIAPPRSIELESERAQRVAH